MSGLYRTISFHFILFALILFAAFRVLPARAALEGPEHLRRTPTAPARDLDVAESTGEANLRIPLEAPKGTGGFEPQLALQYSSQRGDGPFGVGWGLSFGEIRRTTRFGTPLYDASDAFELDGELLIPSTAPNDPSGRYYTASETFLRIVKSDTSSNPASWTVNFPDGTIARYGHTQFTRIRRGGDAAPTNDTGEIYRWLLYELEDAHGNVIRFAYQRQIDAGTAYPLSITYTYRNGQLLGNERKLEFVLADRPDPRISFVGGVEARLSKRVKEIVSSAGGKVFRRLVLSYADEVPAAPAYSTHRSRLAAAQNFGSNCGLEISNPLTGCTGLPQQTFEYTDANQTLPNTASSQWTSSSWQIPIDFGDGTGAQQGRDRGIRLGDVNGDGLPDLVRAFQDSDGSEAHEVYLNHGGGWNTTPDPTWSAALQSIVFSTYFFDLLVTGAPAPYTGFCIDRVRHVATTTSLYFAQRRSYLGVVSGYRRHVTPMNAQLLDLNADGRVDLLVSYEVGKASYVPCGGSSLVHVTPRHIRQAWLNTGSGWAFDATLSAALPPLSFDLTLAFFSQAEKPAPSFMDHGMQFADLNGDSRPDLAGNKTWGLSGNSPVFNSPRGVWFNRPEGWVSGPSSLIPPLPTGAGIVSSVIVNNQNASIVLFDLDTGTRLADVNGDGLMDFIKTAPASIPSSLPDNVKAAINRKEVWLNTGSGWADKGTGWDAAQQYLPPLAFTRVVGSGSTTKSLDNQLFFTDVNGDGLVDLLRLDGSQTGGRAAWLHDPKANPVWVSDARFTPPAGMETVSLYSSGGVQEQVGRGVVIGDLDGDGSLDFARSFSGQRTTTLARASIGDRLRRFTNGAGGELRFEYAAAIRQRDGNLETLAASDAAAFQENTGATLTLWNSLPVVTRVTRRNVDGAEFTSDFFYARPAWCPIQRTHLGFRLLEKRRQDSSSERVYFRQIHGIAGKASRREVHAANGSLVHQQQVIWEVVDGAQVTGSHAGVNVGRVKSESASNVYSGGQLGATRRVTYFYDDAYGFNFANWISVEQPSAETLWTGRTPEPANLGRWIAGLVKTQVLQTSSRTLRRTQFTYDLNTGDLLAQTEHLGPRGNEANMTPTEIARFSYDVYGNLRSRRDPGGRTEFFCYDGDVDSGCPSSSSTTHTVLTAVKDKLGAVSTFSADLASGQILAEQRFNGDQTSQTVDPWNRPMEIYFLPKGTSTWTLLEHHSYFDGTANAAGRPFRETYQVVGGGTQIRSAEYFDGFGLSSHSVSQGPSNTWFGRAQRYDYAGRAIATTYDRACNQDTHCTALNAAPNPEITASYDALGRVLTRTTPDGVEAQFYSRTERAQPVGAAGSGPYDVVLASDRNGNLVRRTLDADRSLWVEECNNSVAPGTTNLSQTSCSQPNTTFYSYEPTGEMAAIYDAVAVATNNYSAAKRKITYVYDTLGRTTEIQDPNGGTTRTAYNTTGTVASTTNARGQFTSFNYDAIDRVTFVNRPTGEADVSLSYDTHTRQRSSVNEANGYSIQYAYDAFSRERRRVQTVAGITLVADFEYDLLNRVRRIQTPFADDAVLYEYSGPYLERICVASPKDKRNCSNLLKDVLVAPTYDALGRPMLTYTPIIVLRHLYDTNTQRVKEITAFDANTTLIDLAYSYDPVGNITSVTDQRTNKGAFDASASYRYDRRNRLASWGRSAQITTYFGYDNVGNLTLRDGGSANGQNQFYEHASKPHAITGTAAGLVEFEYDADGNLNRRRSQQLRYDSMNRLVCAGSTAAPCAQGEYRYDLDGTRIMSRDAEGTTIFFGDLFEWRVTQAEAHVHVSALGQRIATRTKKNPSLRSAGLFFAWRGVFSSRPADFFTELGVFIAWPAVSLFSRGTPLDSTSNSLLWFLGGTILWLLPGGLVLRLAFRARSRVSHISVKHPSQVSITRVLQAFAKVPQNFAKRPLSASLASLLSLSLIAVPLGCTDEDDTAAYRYWYFSDHLGSSLLVMDQNQQILQRRIFEPFGKVIAQEDADIGPSVPQLFTGQRFEKATGLYDFNARWYDPDTAHFTGVDPLLPDPFDPQQHNAYSYARNNPITRIDPSGAFSFSVGLGFGSLSFDSSASGLGLGFSWGPSLGARFNTGSALSPGFGFDAFFAFGGEGSSFGLRTPAGFDFSAIGRGLLDHAGWFGSRGGRFHGGEGVRELELAVGGLVVGGAFQSGISGAAATQNPTGQAPSYSNPLTWVRALAQDVQSLVKGVVVGTPVGIVEGFVNLGRGVIVGDLGRVGLSLLEIATAPLRYGNFGGLAWGDSALFGGGTPTSPLDAGYQGHDIGFGRGDYAAANSALIRSAWSRHDLGPYGQVHRILSTAVFGAHNLAIGAAP